MRRLKMTYAIQSPGRGAGGGGGGGLGQGGQSVRRHCLAFLAPTLFSWLTPFSPFSIAKYQGLRNFSCSRLFRTSTSRPLFSPASCTTPAHLPLFSRAPAPISSPQMWFGVLASRCKEDHDLIPIKQIFVSRIFLCPVINQVNRSFRIESEAARLKSYLEKKKELS